MEEERNFNDPQGGLYSVSLVYDGPKGSLLRSLITRARSAEEALGKAIVRFEKEAAGYGLKMKCTIRIAEESGSSTGGSLDEVQKRFESERFIDNVCLSYRHDFGLLGEEDQQRLRFECREWMRAVVNNWEHFR